MNHKPFRIIINWPKNFRHLSPNGRVHWAQKAKAAKQARAMAAIKTLAWIVDNGPIDPDACVMRYIFFPPTNARRDDDNLAACMKPYRDGIAEALGIDDHRLYTGRVIIMPADKANPRIEIEIINPL